MAYFYLVIQQIFIKYLLQAHASVMSIPCQKHKNMNMIVSFHKISIYWILTYSQYMVISIVSTFQYSYFH